MLTLCFFSCRVIYTITLLMWFNISVIEEQMSKCDNNILEKNKWAKQRKCDHVQNLHHMSQWETSRWVLSWREHTCVKVWRRVWLKAFYSVPSLAISSSQILVSSSISWFFERQREKECLWIVGGRTTVLLGKHP